jgi:DNA-binding response OmpR family regulator
MTGVLVVEDDPSIGEVIRMTLDREGCATVHVSDAGAGIKAFESSDFNLVIVDIFLSDTSGLKLIAELRLRGLAVPIIAMSGFIFRHSMDPVLDYFAMATKAGATICLRKPFAPRQLLAAVHSSLVASNARILETLSTDGNNVGR